MMQLLACPHCKKTNRIPNERFSDNPACGACGKQFFNGALAVNPDGLRGMIDHATQPVIVDFWAPWCGPCRIFAPTFEAAAKKHGGTIIFAKLDTQAHQNAAAAHSIRSIPTLAVFYRGQEIGRVTGALAPSDLEALIMDTLKHARTPAHN
jgi:thioredoxin 2